MTPSSDEEQVLGMLHAHGREYARHYQVLHEMLMGAVVRIDVQYDVGEPGIFQIEVEDIGLVTVFQIDGEGERLAAAVQGRNEDGDSEWFLIKDITQIVKEAPAP